MRRFRINEDLDQHIRQYHYICIVSKTSRSKPDNHASVDLFEVDYGAQSDIVASPYGADVPMLESADDYTDNLF